MDEDHWMTSDQCLLVVDVIYRMRCGIPCMATLTSRHSQWTTPTNIWQIFFRVFLLYKALDVMWLNNMKGPCMV